ncbi:hypothetical protein F4824DRAFT_371049 [Ustulina deusta]|nr:hypothetical protein F4824DRAFT_371049 [Ustulina deusta]
MDELTRKRAQRINPQPPTGKKRLKSPSTLPGSYSRVREGQGATALGAAVLSPTLPLPLPLDTTTFGNNACLVWEGSSRWSSATSMGLPTSWDQHDVLAATTTLGLAAQGRYHCVMSAASTELGFPIIANEIAAIGNSGNGNGSGSDDSPPNNKPLEKWQAPSHSITPLPPPSFASLLNHPSMSCTDVPYYTYTPTQPTNSTGLFAPGGNMTEFNNSFTGAGFGVTSTSFRNPPVDLPETLTFPHEKPHVSEDTLEPTIKFPVTHCHSGHVPNVNRYLDQDDFHLFSSSNEPWYEEEPREPTLDPTAVVQLSPQSRSLLVSEPRFEGGAGQHTAALGRPMPSPHKVVLGGKKAERPRRPRGQLQPKDREETSNTRKRKACIRCRMQKIRCIPDPSKPETECCLCCRKVLLLETKKVIHRIPCLRWNLNEVVLFRVGGLGFTKRWTGVSVENIQYCDWVDERVVTIGMCITTLLCDSLPLKVRRFKPNSTDIQYRHWKDKETEPPILVTVPAYALADVDAASQEYQWFVGQNAEEAIRRFTKDTTVDKYVRYTFSVALSYSAKMASKEFGKTKGDPAKLFRNYFRLWLASRFTIGSAYINDGHENLEGMTYPLCQGKHFISRMITAQFDSIGYKHVLANLKREVLDELWLLMQKRTDATFFTVYLITFMMLHEISVACQDRRRRAREQGLKTYYDLEDVAAKIKHGADIILGHWHYYKGDLDPLSMNQGSIARAFGTDSPEEVQLLMETCQKYGEMKKNPRNETGWEQDPLHLASQMFEQNWQPFQSCWP